MSKFFFSAIAGLLGLFAVNAWMPTGANAAPTSVARVWSISATTSCVNGAAKVDVISKNLSYHTGTAIVVVRNAIYQNGDQLGDPIRMTPFSYRQDWYTAPAGLTRVRIVLKVSRKGIIDRVIVKLPAC